MHPQTRHQAWIFLAATILFFTGLGSTHLWDKDETLYGSCAREMFEHQDWVVPTFNDSLFPDKPPLMYWCMMTGFEVFGVTEFAARFWSAVFGVATAMITYHIGRLLFQPEVGLWAGLAVASNVIFTVSARAATVDSALTFCATLGMLALIVGIRGADSSRQSHSDTDLERPNGSFVMPNWRCLILLYATMGLGFLAKGPVGLVLPLAAAGLFLLIRSAPRHGATPGTGVATRSLESLCGQLVRVFHPRHVLQTTWRMRPITAAVVLLLVAVPWYVLVGIRTDGEWLQKFFFEQNAQRALRPFDNHGGSLFYYVLAMSIGLFPWSVFLPGSVIQLVRSLRNGDKHCPSYLLLSCWIGVYVVFWSLVSTKLPHYVLPAYPALAVMMAAFIQARMASPTELSVWWARYAVVWLLAVGAGMAVALPIVTRIFVPGEELLGLIGLIPLLAGVWCLVWFERARPELALQGFAFTSVLLVLAIFTVGAQRVDRHQTAPPILNALRERGNDTRDLIAYRYLRESFVFYAGHPITVCHDLDQLQAMLAIHPQRRILTTSDRFASIEAEYPGRFNEVARTPRFLKQGDVVVLVQVATPSSGPHSVGDELTDGTNRLAQRHMSTTGVERTSPTPR